MGVGIDLGALFRVRRCRYNLPVSDEHPKSVGLGGDGDELFAIDDVERAFNVKLDYADAARWKTAGDLFASLQKVLPERERDGPEMWAKFATALAGQTGIDPSDIQPGSPLLSESRFWARLADASAVVWIVAFLGLVVAIAIAVL